MKTDNLKTGYYWVEIHPIFEENEPTVAYFNKKTRKFYLINLEGDQTNIIKKVIEPIFIQTPFGYAK